MVERSRRAALERCGFSPEGGEQLAASDLSGRGPLAEIHDGSERYVVRRFHHGGVLRWLGQHLYLRPARPFRELCLAVRLAGAGIATPGVVAARARRSRFLGWNLALVTQRVDGADGARWLETLTAGARSTGQRARFFACTGDLVGRLHAVGFLHSDLTPRNLLVSSDLQRAWVLDLDGGRFADALDGRVRLDNLRRLYRWVRRRSERGRFAPTRTDHLRFLLAYRVALGTPLGGHAEDRARSWRADWRAIVARDRAASALHRVGWWIEELLGGGPEGRDGPPVPRVPT